jgi:hypothetical protein
MKQIYCGIHNIDILIYHKKQRILFKDDNRKEVAIFYDDSGKKYLKRCIIGLCDESCLTVQEALKKKEK